MVLKGHKEDPEPLAAAWTLVPTHGVTHHTLAIRIAQGTLLGLLGVPGRDEDLAFGT